MALAIIAAATAQISGAIIPEKPSQMPMGKYRRSSAKLAAKPANPIKTIGRQSARSATPVSASVSAAAMIAG